MTRAQQAALDTIRANGGYACLDYGSGSRRWSCAGFEGNAYYPRWPLLSARVMDRLQGDGMIRSVQGRYSAKSFWEPTPDA